MEEKTVEVEITSCSGHYYWYRHRIGEILTVVPQYSVVIGKEKELLYYVYNEWKNINVGDCREITRKDKIKDIIKRISNGK